MKTPKLDSEIALLALDFGAEFGDLGVIFDGQIGGLEMEDLQNWKTQEG